MKFDEIKEREDAFQLATYAKMGIAVERGAGSWIWTTEGEKYLDLYGGHAVCATGHSHPKIVEAIAEQASKLIFYSNLVYSRLRAEVAERLADLAPAGISKVFFCNSGTEANENAMRIARLATGREKIVSFSGGFHGRTADSISATFLGRYREIGRPNVPMHVEVAFGDTASIRELIDGETAGVIIEPIQSMAGVREAAPEFFLELREICDRVGAVLIFDEVQTGIGRTGDWFFSGGERAGGVVPDIITLAKALGSGVPVGACLIRNSVASGIKEGDLGTTFGGGMLAMAAVLATLDVIESEKLLESAVEAERYLREALKANDAVAAIHGAGCLLGIEFTEPCRPIHSKLLADRILTGTSSAPKVLRLLPPLNVRRDELALLVEALAK